MKKTIIILAFGGAHWIGGLYYVKNIAFQLTQNAYITDNYRIAIYTTVENAPLFSELEDKADIIIAKKTEGLPGKLEKALVYLFHHVKVAFPAEKSLLGVRAVSWIPDFQHKHLPEMFPSELIDERDRNFSAIAQSGNPLVLSSEDAIEDFKRFYRSDSRVYCVHFVSYIENYLNTMTASYEDAVLKKHAVEKGRYAVIMNQFWKHKNHLVALRAFEQAVKAHPALDLKLVLTGNLSDRRNPEYISEIEAFLNRPDLQGKLIFLGLIDRQEQLCLMKNAAFVIQPSLFEGWGTVVEDAKVLDKTILLSDIPVHREQMNEKCVLFAPHDANALAELLVREGQKEHHDCVEAGLANMRSRAAAYSKGFEALLRDLEKNG